MNELDHEKAKESKKFKLMEEDSDNKETTIAIKEDTNKFFYGCFQEQHDSIPHLETLGVD